MVCIYCSASTFVTNSRLQKQANQVWRRRQCKQCASIFTTLEGADLHSALMVKTNKQLQPFSRDKLYISVYDSLRHRTSAVEDAEALTLTIISTVRGLIQNGVVDSVSIASVSKEVLERFDATAGTVYGAYHQH